MICEICGEHIYADEAKVEEPIDSGEYMHLWCAIEAGDDDIINSEHNGD